MADYEAKEIVSETGPIGESNDGAKHRAVERQNVKSPDAEHRPHGKRVEGDANVIGEDLGGSDLVGVVKAFPPVFSVINYRLTEKWTDSRELRKIRVVASAKKSDRAEQ